MSNGTQECRHCGDDIGPYGSSVKGLCGSCCRKSSIVFSNNGDGTYNCSLCAFGGEQTAVDPGEQAEHIREEHGIEDDDPLTRIREYERIAADQDHRQTGFHELATDGGQRE